MEQQWTTMSQGHDKYSKLTKVTQEVNFYMGSDSPQVKMGRLTSERRSGKRNCKWEWQDL